MNKFETERHRLKVGFWVCVVLLPVVLPILAPMVGVREGGRISLSALQVLYVVLSVEIAIAVYIWGVGNWSRYEPPPNSASTTQEANSAPK